MTMRRAILSLFALGILALTVWAFRPRPVDVEVAEVALRTIEVSVEEEGVAQISEVFVVSATIAGKLQRIGLHAGDHVAAGKTVVAVIGPVAPALLDARARAVAEAAMAAAQSAVDLAQAQVTQAQAALDFRSSDADRSRTLFDKAAISQHQLDSAVLEQKTAAAALDSARANLGVRRRELESAEAVLDSTAVEGTGACCVELTAPVSGQILRVLTEDEQVVQPGTPILEIGNPVNLVVKVDLLSRDAVRVHEGADARISGWGGPTLAATVERVEPSATTRTSALGIDEQRVKVVLRLTGDPQQWHALGHGFRVIADIALWRGENVLSIPVGALFRDGSNWATFVMQDGRARLRTLQLGERNDEFAQVDGGLQAHDVVILHPGDLIADGTLVARRAVN
jgi:HlyD family secretion protein